MTQHNTLLKILNAAIVVLMLIVLGMMFTRAHAGVITRTLDFQDNPPGLNGPDYGESNFDYGGLRFSPKCHIQAGHSGSQIWLHSAHDNAVCDHDRDRGPINPDFLGFDWENLYVDRHDKPFTLLGLAGVGSYDFTVISSKGGHFRGEMPRGPLDPDVLLWEWFALSGPLWTDITWFTLSNGAELPLYVGWDDIRVSWQVDEPPLWSLLAAAGAIAFRRRFAKRFFHWRDA